MKTGRVDCVCGSHIISNSGKALHNVERLGMIKCWGCDRMYNNAKVEAFRVDGQAVTYSMKIFKMNEYDWWMDIDLDSAKKNYMEHIGFVGEVDDELFDNPRELTNEEPDNHTFRDEEGYNKCSFREEMNSMDQVPQFFASTEY